MKFQLTTIKENRPPESKKKDISKPVTVYDGNKNFIGRDTYNLKLERWMISRETVKYWLMEINEPTRLNADKIVEKSEHGYLISIGGDLVYCQRTELSTASENPFSDIEKALIIVCEALLFKPTRSSAEEVELWNEFLAGKGETALNIACYINDNQHHTPTEIKIKGGKTPQEIHRNFAYDEGGTFQADGHVKAMIEFARQEVEAMKEQPKMSAEEIHRKVQHEINNRLDSLEGKISKADKAELSRSYESGAFNELQDLKEWFVEDIVRKHLFPSKQQSKDVRGWLKDHRIADTSQYWSEKDKRAYKISELFTAFLTTSEQIEVKCTCGGYPECICDIVRKHREDKEEEFSDPTRDDKDEPTEPRKLIGAEGYKEFEIETCECGHVVPLGFIQYDTNSCGKCVNCVNDELIFRLGKKNKQIKNLKTKLNQSDNTKQ